MCAAAILIVVPNVGAVRGIPPPANVPDRQRRDRRPQWVVRCEAAVIPVPVPPRLRDQIRKPVEELKRRELDDAVGPRLRRLSLPAWLDPVGRLVSSRSRSVIRTLASIENPLFSQASVSAAAAASSRPLRLNQPITRRRTRSVSAARSPWVSGLAGQ